MESQDMWRIVDIFFQKALHDTITYKVHLALWMLCESNHSILKKMI
jgi:ABC-type uncharacterized transport system permease subunit